MSPRTKEQNDAVRSERKTLIEEAALEVFAEDGYHAASISKIAKNAGVAKGTIYTYFESKEQLLKELIRDVITDVMNRIDIPMDKDLQDKDVIKFINGSLDLVKESPQRWRLFFEVFLQKDVMALMMDEMMKMATMFMEPFINYFESKGHKDASDRTRYFHASIDGVQMQLMMSPNEFPLESVKKMIIKQFVES